jgi:hypothetical protein
MYTTEDWAVVLEAKNNRVTLQLYNLKFGNKTAEQWFAIITGIM